MELAFPWLWYRLAAAAAIGLLTQACPYASGGAVKRKKKNKSKTSTQTVRLGITLKVVYAKGIQTVGGQMLKKLCIISFVTWGGGCPLAERSIGFSKAGP